MKANEHKKKKGFSAGATNYLHRPGDSIPSRTAEAVQFLREREQASWMLPQSRLASGNLLPLQLINIIRGKPRPTSAVKVRSCVF